MRPEGHDDRVEPGGCHGGAGVTYTPATDDVNATWRARRAVSDAATRQVATFVGGKGVLIRCARDHDVTSKELGLVRHAHQWLDIVK
jgi:hypothetical protein